MNKRIFAVVAIAFFMVLPLFAATQRVQALSTTVSVQSMGGSYDYTYFYVNIGDRINFTLNVAGVSSLWSWKVNMTWNDTMLHLAPTNNVTEGPFLDGAGATMFIVAPPTLGNIPELSSTLLENVSVSGSGPLAYTSFTVQNYGNTTINITDTRLLDPSGNDISNTPVSKIIALRLKGDVTGDNKVDIVDVATVAKQFGRKVPPASEVVDINHDGKIDITDVALTAKNFGRHYP